MRGERRFEHPPFGDGLRAGVDRLARLLQLFREGRNQAPCQGVEGQGAVDKPNDRRVHRRRHVPGRREVGQRIHRREQSSDELSREETGVAAAHAEEGVTSAADATTAALAAREIAARREMDSPRSSSAATQRPAAAGRMRLGRSVAPRAGWPMRGQGRGPRPARLRAGPTAVLEVGVPHGVAAVPAAAFEAGGMHARSMLVLSAPCLRLWPPRAARAKPGAVRTCSMRATVRPSIDWVPAAGGRRNSGLVIDPPVQHGTLFAIHCGGLPGSILFPSDAATRRRLRR